jgi:hypothetical protein
MPTHKSPANRALLAALKATTGIEPVHRAARGSRGKSLQTGGIPVYILVGLLTAERRPAMGITLNAIACRR